MAATRLATTEAQVRGAMEGVILAHNLTPAYGSIVTVHGEVLHNEHYHHPLQPTDLLLVDVGAETPTGWASDVTLRGKPADLVEMDAHALFFPHGIGHLLGLDVHDREDLGDLAGYAAGRKRSDRLGLGCLRLDRPLRAGMLVTIEPGFYQVPAILNKAEFRTKYHSVVNWERLAQFGDVRGIRIEDDVLVTESGAEVLTAELPNRTAEIERLCCQ